MALAGPQSNRPFLPPIPRQLPKTQPDWEQVANAFLDWQGALSPTWTAPVLQNGWVNYGTGYEPAGYCIDISGRVWLRGLVKSGAGAIFTVPTGYAPAYEVIVPAVTSADVFADVRISTSGVVTSTGNSTWVSLSGISFSTVP